MFEKLEKERFRDREWVLLSSEDHYYKLAYSRDLRDYNTASI